VRTDIRKWDYKHQVLETRHLKPWQLFAMVKAIEVVSQSRPRAARRLFHADPRLRHAQRWYTQMGRRVWFHEVQEFLRDMGGLVESGPTLEAVWGEPQDAEERAMRRRG